MMTLPAYLDLIQWLHRLPSVLADADDVIGLIIFVIIAAVMLIFKAIATAQQNARSDGGSRRQKIADSIRQKRSQIQARAEEIRRQSRPEGPNVAIAGESPHERRERLHRQRLLQNQGRADDARTEYDLVGQRREQLAREAESKRRQVTPTWRPSEAQSRPQPAQQQPAPTLVARRATQPLQSVAGSTAPVKSGAIAAGAIGKPGQREDTERSVAPRSLAAALRRRMSGNQLREYLVASEVLGKPLALREPRHGH